MMTLYKVSTTYGMSLKDGGKLIRKIPFLRAAGRFKAYTVPEFTLPTVMLWRASTILAISASKPGLRTASKSVFGRICDAAGALAAGALAAGAIQNSAGPLPASAPALAACPALDPW